MLCHLGHALFAEATGKIAENVDERQLQSWTDLTHLLVNIPVSCLQISPNTMGMVTGINSLTSARQSILVAEDDELLRYTTVRALQSCGYQVLEASDGAKALKVAELHKEVEIDLLISDLHMPNMSGDELAQQLKRFSPTLLVIIVTGAKLDDIPTDLKSNVTDVLSKPLNTALLLECVSNLLNG